MACAKPSWLWLGTKGVGHHSHWVYTKAPVQVVSIVIAFATGDAYSQSVEWCGLRQHPGWSGSCDQLLLFLPW
jgi:hypothetical protein